MSIKVLMVLNELDWFWSHRLPLANAIIENGWQLSVATHETTSDPRIVDHGIEPIDLPRMGSSINLLSHIMFTIALHRAIRKLKPDIVHGITIRYALYLGLVTRFTNYKPVLFTVAGLGSLFSSSSFKFRVLRFFASPILAFAFGGGKRFVIFQNPDDQEILISRNIVQRENASLIRGSGVDLTAFPYIPYNKPESSPIVLFASRLLRDKGIADFIAAAKKLKESGTNATFIVAGDLIDNNPRFISRSDIEKAHSEGTVIWRGKVNEMQPLLAESALFVFPSYYGEGVPKVLLEAAATGRSIITCDVPGCREVVTHGLNGILVEPKNPQQLAHAIKTLLNDEVTRNSYGSEGRRIVEADFHTEIVVEKTINVYKKALGK